MADININVKASLDQLNKLEELIKKSNLSKAQKSDLDGQVGAAKLALQSRNLRSSDISRIEKAVRDIVKSFQKAAGKIPKYAKEIEKLEKAIEAESKRLDNATAQRRKMANRQLIVDDQGEPIKIRDAELKRFLDKNPVRKNELENYRSLEGVKAAAARGDQAAVDFFNKAKTYFDQLAKEYQTLVTTELDAGSQIRKHQDEIGSWMDKEEMPSFVSDFNKTGQEMVDALRDLKNVLRGQEEAVSRKQAPPDEGYSPDDLTKLAQFKAEKPRDLGHVFKQFTLYAIAIRTAKRAMQEAVTTIKELDKYLTEQAMVTNKTRKETQALLKSYQEMAVQLGATTKEVAEVATEFMRQGKTTADALTLTNAAVSAAKVAAIGVSESVSYLTTALNGYQLGAEKAMAVSDKFAAIAAQSATSYEEIATALSKVAAQANMAAMSIDYTIAILAKGIETTREAPETIGTALKTIVARMRELTDYGATLEDGMSINNVEEQLAYVGIVLRDQKGELRSTQDVLDELGRKWDKLSSNQQAALAKALAGTRQQSRLIAMMSDYDRVIELQEISQRSAGATAAQAGVYLEGMEAALNKVNVAWEKIVTTITNSDTLIKIIEAGAKILEWIAERLENEVVVIGSIIIISSIALGTLIKRYETQKMMNRAALEEEKTRLEGAKAESIKRETQLKIYLEGLKILKNLVKSKKLTAEQLKLEIEQSKLKGDDLKAFQAEMVLRQTSLENLTTEAEVDAEIQRVQAEITAERFNQRALGASIYENEVRTAQNAAGLKSIVMQTLTPLSAIAGMAGTIFSVLSAINVAKAAGVKISKAQRREDEKGIIVSKAKAAWDMASSAGKIPFVGWAIAIAILAAIGLGIVVNVARAKQMARQAEKTSDSINKLSNEIYKMTEASNAIKTINDQYDALDKKILKTIEDQKQMNELLATGADKLSNEAEKGQISDRDFYESLSSSRVKREYLQQKEIEYRQKANELRAEQIDLLKRSSKEMQNYILTNKKETEFLQVQDAVYATNNNTLYEYIDTLENVDKQVEVLTQQILENLDSVKAWEIALDDSHQTIKRLVNAIAGMTGNFNGYEESLAMVLQTDKYTIKERVEAYRQLHDEIRSLGDPELLKAFTEAFSQWNNIVNKFEDSVIDLIDDLGITIEKINNLGAELEKVGVGTDSVVDKMSDLFQLVSSGAGLKDSIFSVFAEEIAMAADATEKYMQILQAWEKAVATGALNMGQNITSLRSQINRFYDVTTKWGEMTDMEKTAFMEDNAFFFQGAQGAEFYQALESQNFELIQKTLAKNDAFKEQIKVRLRELYTDLAIEKAKTLDKQNQAYIDYLKEQIELLSDYENEKAELYQASLKLRLDQENAQLDAYKDFLSKQREALEESLDKRKEAYEKYFRDIDEQLEDADYEERAEQLITNLGRLVGNTDNLSKRQEKELQKELRDLEEERLKTLRERARELILNSIDNTLEEINRKFDEMLENDNLVLKALTSQITGDTSAFLRDFLASGLQGKTFTGAEAFLEDFKSQFGSILPAGSLDGIRVDQDHQGNFSLYLGEERIELGELTRQELADAIKKAMRQVGIII